MVREGQKRGEEQDRSEIDNSGSKVHANLSGAVFHASLSAERDDDKQQSDQGCGCRRREEIEIRPSLEFIHKLTVLSRSHSATRSPSNRKIESSPLPGSRRDAS